MRHYLLFSRLNPLLGGGSGVDEVLCDGGRVLGWQMSGLSGDVAWFLLFGFDGWFLRKQANSLSVQHWREEELPMRSRRGRKERIICQLQR